MFFEFTKCISVKHCKIKHQNQVDRLSTFAGTSWGAEDAEDAECGREGGGGRDGGGGDPVEQESALPVQTVFLH